MSEQKVIDSSPHDHLLFRSKVEVVADYVHLMNMVLVGATTLFLMGRKDDENKRHQEMLAEINRQRRDGEITPDEAEALKGWGNNAHQEELGEIGDDD